MQFHMRKLDRDRKHPQSVSYPEAHADKHISTEKYLRQGNDAKIQPVPRISQVSKLI